MISMNEERVDSDVRQPGHSNGQANSTIGQHSQLGVEVVARMKKLAVERPLLVVAAGLAVGVFSGLMLKRR